MAGTAGLLLIILELFSRSIYIGLTVFNLCDFAISGS